MGIHQGKDEVTFEVKAAPIKLSIGGVDVYLTVERVTLEVTVSIGEDGILSEAWAIKDIQWRNEIVYPIPTTDQPPV